MTALVFIGFLSTVERSLENFRSERYLNPDIPDTCVVLYQLDVGPTGSWSLRQFMMTHRRRKVMFNVYETHILFAQRSEPQEFI